MVEKNLNKTLKDLYAENNLNTGLAPYIGNGYSSEGHKRIMLVGGCEWFGYVTPKTIWSTYLSEKQWEQFDVVGIMHPRELCGNLWEVLGESVRIF